MVKRFLTKSKLSTYLRSQCDRQLYLSLFSNDPDGLSSAGLPIPIKTRPSVQLVTQSGREFELDQFDKLTAVIPAHTVFASKYSPLDLPTALQNPPNPAFLLQPEIEPELFRDIALDNLGLTKAEKTCIPKLSGLRPDILYVHSKTANDYEVLPNGKRKRIESSDTRLAISVLDLKNVTEANSSYSAEVCLYAFFLSNWLSSQPTALQSRYYVSHRVFLWKHIEMPNFEKMLGSRDGASANKRIEALLIDLEDGLVDFLIFMPSVKKFFKEDIPRVVYIGDANGWQAVNYHVNPKCGSCDWLGNKEWLWGDSLKTYEAHPEHYCLHSAEISDHLSKMAGLSKGASHILIGEGKSTIANLVDIASNNPVLKKHAFLKKDKSQIGERAKAINTGNSSIDDSVRVGGLASYRNAEYNIIVNFDSGAGLLTGIGIRGMINFPPGQTADIDGTQVGFISLNEDAFVVGKDFLSAEWATLLSFINKLSSWITRAEEIFEKNGWGLVYTQVCFWEQRQYQELCNAFSRHLLEVLTLTDRQSRAIAWIFPADELMEKDEQIAPGIVFIKDIVESSTRLSVKFSNTLLGVAEAYHLDAMSPRKIDTYYKEPLGNAIPRERIFEIWKSSTGVVPMYGKPAPLADAVKKYGDILKSHAWALSSITGRLRIDLKGRLQAKAPAIVLSISSGATKVAYDSKLWIQWDNVEASTSETQGKLNLITKTERLEASYEAILLTKMITNLGNHRYEFEVSEESTEAKLEEGGAYYVLGLANDPGFPLLTGAKLGLTPNPPEYDIPQLRTPMYQLIAVTIESFDRVNLKAIISLRARWGGVEGLFKELFDIGHISITDKPICILEGLPYNDSKTTLKILREVGDPSVALVSKEALLAMGNLSKKLKKGTDVVTPIARVFWDAKTLSQNLIRSDVQANSVKDFAIANTSNGLNPSQVKTIFECAKSQLSIIWGPPGTGKTDTLSSLLHAITYEGQTQSTPKKILITGPNYRAVEELAERLLQKLNLDNNSKADLFWVYSQSRDPKIMPDSATHLNARTVRLRSGDGGDAELMTSMKDPNKVTIVSTTAHTVPNITRLLFGKDTDLINEIFDLVVIDESSQVQLTLAMRPLSTLKSQGQLIIAGDHLQMPPIASLEPPKDGEYLVGSIQTYLLERFPDIVKQELLINYRSNQDLVDFAKTLGYPHELQAHIKDRRLENIADIDAVIKTLPDNLPKSDGYAEILAPNNKVVTVIHDDIVSSQANEFEAKLVVGIAFCLRQSMSRKLHPKGISEEYEAYTDEEFFKTGIGVVTPHKAQKALVLRELRRLFPYVDPQIIFEAVDTVERFQGGERQTIIVSFGVGDTDIIAGEEGFLLQMERTNVAVSRAKAKCIVLMPKALAYHLPTDPKATKSSRAIKSYIEEFCSNRREIQITDSYGVVRNGEVRWH